MTVSFIEALRIGNILGSKFPTETLQKGMEVELEHKDITHGDLVMTAKIALAHLKENPEYYRYLGLAERLMDNCGGERGLEKRLRCKWQLLNDITREQDYVNLSIYGDLRKSKGEKDPRWIPTLIVDHANAVILGISDSRGRVNDYAKEKLVRLGGLQWRV